MDPELKAYLDAMRAEIRAVDSGLRAYIEHEVLPPIRQIAEGHQMLREHIDRRFQEYDRSLADKHVAPLEAAVRDLSTDVAQVKVDVRNVKHDVEAIHSDAADLRRTDADHEARISALERRTQA